MRLLFLSICFVLFSNVWGLNLEIQASENPEPVCIRYFVSQGQLAVVDVKSNGYVGDGQVLSLKVTDTLGNQYRRRDDFAGKIRVAFEAPLSTSFDVCMENTAKTRGNIMSRIVELNIESGSEARDWDKVQASEKLKPLEVELRRIEELTDEIFDELDYLKFREEKLRDTNESTNRRIRNFSVAVIFVFVALGAWQINYLKTYFRAKNII